MKEGEKKERVRERLVMRLFRVGEGVNFVTGYDSLYNLIFEARGA